MAEIVVMLVFLWYLFFNMAFSFVNYLLPLLSILCKSLPVVYGDVCSLYVSFHYIFVSQSTTKTFPFGG